jgi:hypothetical protein
MTNAQKVVEFLLQHSRSWYCDSCISRSIAVEPPNQVNRVRRPLGSTPGFNRVLGKKCRRCLQVLTCTKTNRKLRRTVTA